MGFSGYNDRVYHITESGANSMITVTKLNDQELVINSDLIEFVESIPDTIITLTTGKKIMVKEKPQDVINKVAAFRKVSFPTPSE